MVLLHISWDIFLPDLSQIIVDPDQSYLEYKESWTLIWRTLYVHCWVLYNAFISLVCRRNIIFSWLKRYIKYSESLKRSDWSGCKSRAARTIQIKDHGNEVLWFLQLIAVQCSSTIVRTDFSNPVSDAFHGSQWSA